MPETPIHKPIDQELTTLGVPLDASHFVPVYDVDPGGATGALKKYVSANQVLGGGQWVGVSCTDK